VHYHCVVAFIRLCFCRSTHISVTPFSINDSLSALYELNALPVAKVAFEEALEIQRQNLRDSPTTDGTCNRSNETLLSIASTLSNIASIKLYLNQFDEASADYQEALLVQQAVFGDDHPIPRQTEKSLNWIEEVQESSTFSGTGRLAGLSNLLRSSLAAGSNRVLSCSHPTLTEEIGEARRTRALQSTRTVKAIANDTQLRHHLSKSGPATTEITTRCDVALTSSPIGVLETFDGYLRYTSLGSVCGLDDDGEDDDESSSSFQIGLEKIRRHNNNDDATPATATNDDRRQERMLYHV